MDKPYTRKISAIVRSEPRLETIIESLIPNVVALHDVSVQGSPEKMANKYGLKFIKPDFIQQNNSSPKQEPFLKDDFGWVLGFSFSIPLFLGIIIGVFFIGDVRLLEDNFLYGFLGGLIGAALGFFLSNIIKKHHLNSQHCQEEKGGYVLWITVSSDDQMTEVVNILEKYNAIHIQVE